jgi:hypothetical protein
MSLSPSSPAPMSPGVASPSPSSTSLTSPNSSECFSHRTATASTPAPHPSHTLAALPPHTCIVTQDTDVTVSLPVPHETSILIPTQDPASDPPRHVAEDVPDPQAWAHRVCMRVGGLDEVVLALCRLLAAGWIARPRPHPRMQHVLLHGPSGCGKTLLARTVAAEAGAAGDGAGVGCTLVHSADIFAAADPCRALRSIFARAGVPVAEEGSSLVHRSLGIRGVGQRHIIVLDDVDGLCTNSQVSDTPLERSVCAQLLACLEASSSPACNVAIISVAANPSRLPAPAFSPARGCVSILLGPLPPSRRWQLFQFLLRATAHGRSCLEGGMDDLHVLCDGLHGYSGADLKRLCDCAARVTFRIIISFIVATFMTLGAFNAHLQGGVA